MTTTRLRSTPDGSGLADAGVSDRVHFEVASGQAFPGSGYDLVAMFDCLHDMGDPVGAARRVRSALAPDGTWLIVEPYANDAVEDNLNPVGRVYYGASTLVCTPASLSQPVGLGLGAQAGEARLRDVVTAGGFTRFRRASETPFNLVLEARPGQSRPRGLWPRLSLRRGPERRCELVAVSYAELLVDVTEVVLDGLRADEERRGSLPRRSPTSEQRCDRVLLRCRARPASRCLGGERSRRWQRVRWRRVRATGRRRASRK